MPNEQIPVHGELILDEVIPTRTVGGRVLYRAYPRIITAAGAIFCRVRFYFENRPPVNTPLTYSLLNAIAADEYTANVAAFAALAQAA